MFAIRLRSEFIKLLRIIECWISKNLSIYIKLWYFSRRFFFFIFNVILYSNLASNYFIQNLFFNKWIDINGEFFWTFFFNDFEFFNIINVKQEQVSFSWRGKKIYKLFNKICVYDKISACSKSCSTQTKSKHCRTKLIEEMSYIIIILPSPSINSRFLNRFSYKKSHIKRL